MTLLKKVLIVICHYGIGMVTKVAPLDYKIKSDWIKQVKNMESTFFPIPVGPFTCLSLCSVMYESVFHLIVFQLSVFQLQVYDSFMADRLQEPTLLNA